MATAIHEYNGKKIAEVTGSGIIVGSVNDAMQIMMDQSYAGVNRVIFHKSNIVDKFFDLKTGLLGELLQKAVNYRVKIAFIGDFSAIDSKSLKAFIYESNQGNQNFFTESVSGALTLLTKSKVK
tara:strand:- start:3658 stop:4029 length:372 start_codon:yes stop_codon:yes gene_type:complete